MRVAIGAQPVVGGYIKIKALELNAERFRMPAGRHALKLSNPAPGGTYGLGCITIDFLIFAQPIDSYLIFVFLGSAGSWFQTGSPRIFCGYRFYCGVVQRGKVSPVVHQGIPHPERCRSDIAGAMHPVWVGCIQ